MTALAFMGGHWEYLIILVVVLLLFGNRIPSMARSMGSGIVEFKKGLKDGESGSGSDQAGSAGAGSKESGSKVTASEAEGNSKDGG